MHGINRFRTYFRNGPRPSYTEIQCHSKFRHNLFVLEIYNASVVLSYCVISVLTSIMFKYLLRLLDLPRFISFYSLSFYMLYCIK